MSRFCKEIFSACDIPRKSEIVTKDLLTKGRVMNSRSKLSALEKHMTRSTSHSGDFPGDCILPDRVVGLKWEPDDSQ